jgi:hypothetical protein
MLKRTIYPLLLAIAAAWLATPADAFQQRLYRRAEVSTGDANCLLLCHFDGTDGATTTTDSSLSAHAITLAGDAQLDTAEKQYGTASLLLDGTGDYADTPNTDDFRFGTGDFTIEGWFRFNNTTGNHVLVSSGDFINGGTQGWAFVSYGSTPGANQFIFAAAYDDGSWTIWAETTWARNANTWYHLAVSRQNGTIRFWVDGTQVGTDISASASTEAKGTVSAQFRIGASCYSTDYMHNGSIDELRISNTARYTSAFTPAGPFTP